MPNYYEISPTDDTVNLRDGKGTASLTVRYTGARPVEARAQVIAIEGADSGWLTVKPPTSKRMEPNQTHTFQVGVEVPPGTPTGRHALRLDVMSVDNTDEEYDQGPPVWFKVAEAKAPTPPKTFPWWLVILIAIVLALAIGGLVWWLNTDEQPPDRPPPIATGEIDFRTFSRTGPISANDIDADWIESIRAAPKGGYCTDAIPVILPQRHYRLPFPVLSTASPGQINRCNGVELAVELRQPARHIAVEFYGAKIDYQLRAFDADGNQIATNSASSTPYNYDNPSRVAVGAPRGNPIVRFEFGHQTALTLVSKVRLSEQPVYTARPLPLTHDVLIPIVTDPPDNGE